MKQQKGYERLWHWFGLSRASWVTLPRVLMHEMPDKWQKKMAMLLEEYDKFWDFTSLDYETLVNLKENNKFIKTPEWLINYRHPDYKKINSLRNGYISTFWKKFIDKIKIKFILWKMKI